MRSQRAGRSHRSRRRSQKTTMIYFCIRSQRAGRSHRSMRRSQKTRMSYFFMRSQRTGRSQNEEEVEEPNAEKKLELEADPSLPEPNAEEVKREYQPTQQHFNSNRGERRRRIIVGICGRSPFPGVISVCISFPMPVYIILVT